MRYISVLFLGIATATGSMAMKPPDGMSQDQWEAWKQQERQIWAQKGKEWKDRQERFDEWKLGLKCNQYQEYDQWNYDRERDQERDQWNYDRERDQERDQWNYDQCCNDQCRNGQCHNSRVFFDDLLSLFAFNQAEKEVVFEAIRYQPEETHIHMHTQLSQLNSWGMDEDVLRKIPLLSADLKGMIMNNITLIPQFFIDILTRFNKSRE